ncbi:MAG TPA: hypothetical protein VFS43_06370 [Polyangiaceae bacterium]|nr:hypothetical protein [Polyangiaceae bacterium]
MSTARLVGDAVELASAAVGDEPRDSADWERERDAALARLADLVRATSTRPSYDDLFALVEADPEG